MSKLTLLQIMPAENGFIVQIQHEEDSQVRSFVSDSATSAIALVSAALQIPSVPANPDAQEAKAEVAEKTEKAKEVIADDSADAEADAHSKAEAKKEAAAEAKAEKAAAAAAKKAVTAAKKAAEKEAKALEKDSPSLRDMMVKAGKATCGPDVVAAFKPFGFKNVVDAEDNASPEVLAEIIAALQGLIDNA